MGETGPARYRVRRIARRPGQPFTLSDDRFLRSWQRRGMAYTGFIVLCVSALLYRKAASRYGTFVPASVIGALVLLPFIAALLRRRAGPPAPTADSEATVSTQNIEEELRAGTLSPGDLVLEGEHWTTLADSIQFGEVASELQARTRRTERLQMAALILLGVAVLVLVLAAFANYGRVGKWLLED